MKTSLRSMRCIPLTMLSCMCLTSGLFSADLHPDRSKRPDRIKERRDQVAASLVPAKPIPKEWLQAPILPGMMVQEREQAWSAYVAASPPVENTPGRKNSQKVDRERNDAVERRDVFLSRMAQDKTLKLYSFDGGPGNPHGYVLVRGFDAAYHYTVGINPPKPNPGKSNKQ